MSFKDPLLSVSLPCPLYIHLYSSEKLIAQRKKKKTITIRTRKASNHLQAKRSETIFNKTARWGGIFNIKPSNTIWPQITWQVKREKRLTISYNLYVICSPIPNAPWFSSETWRHINHLLTYLLTYVLTYFIMITIGLVAGNPAIAGIADRTALSGIAGQHAEVNIIQPARAIIYGECNQTMSLLHRVGHKSKLTIFAITLSTVSQFS